MLRANSISTEHTGNLVLPANQNRRLFFIVQTVGASTIEFGGGGGKIPLEEGMHYIPPCIPLDKISIETAGTFVLHTSGDDL